MGLIMVEAESCDGSGGLGWKLNLLYAVGWLYLTRYGNGTGHLVYMYKIWYISNYISVDC